MLSTLSSYRIYSNDIAKSLDRLQASPTISKDTKYYDETISKVKTAEEFLSNQRLYAYAMKAYGLEDQIQSKGFMRKVIESDLSSTTSFANKLTDQRYRQFAAAFQFGAASETKTAQSTGQTEGLVEAYSERRVRGAVAAAGKTGYFERTIGQVTSIDGLLDDPVLYDVALRSAGLDPTLLSKSYVRDIFTSVAGIPTQPGMTELGTLASSFSFRADGTVAPGAVALTAAKTNQLIYAYNKATDNAAGSQAAAHESANYAASLAGVDSADDITGNPRLFEYVMTAYGFDPSIETASYMYSILTSDPADATGVLANLPTATAANVARKELLTALNAAFDFNANGSVAAGRPAQSAEKIAATQDAYYARYQDIANRKDASAVSTYKTILARTKSLGDLMASDPVFGRDALKVALKAFDLDPATESLSKIRRVLQSDPSDPDSFVGKLKDERYTKLAAAFNFDANGKARTQQLVQSTSAQSQTGALYAATFGTPLSTERKAVVTADTKSYLTALADIHTLPDLLADDKVVSYALTAYGLGKETISDDKLRKILTSDLGDKSSYVYTLKDQRYEKLAAAFNFTKTGLVRIESSGVQTDARKLSTENLYLLQTLEENAGDAGEGTRLALYFLRKSPEIKTTLSILADKALVEVVKTALSLPDSLSQLDIDAQVKAIEKKLKVADLQDAKKLDAFIARFAGLYDLKNSSGASAPIMGLFDTSASSTGLLASL